MEEDHKKYILIAVGVIVVLAIVYFLFKKPKNNDPVKTSHKKRNLYIALKATGAVIEEFDAKQDEMDQKACEGMLSIIFGKDSDGGLNAIYEDVTGKKFTEERFVCRGKSREQIDSDGKRIVTLLTEMYLSILKNPNINKRNNDMVSAWVIMLYGIASVYAPGMFRLDIDRDGDNIKTIEFTLNDPNAPAGQQTVKFTPSALIAKSERNLTFSDNSTQAVKNRTDIKEAAKPLVVQSEIDRLKADTNPKMTVDKLATCVIYELSKIGQISL